MAGTWDLTNSIIAHLKEAKRYTQGKRLRGERQREWISLQTLGEREIEGAAAGSRLCTATGDRCILINIKRIWASVG